MSILSEAPDRPGRTSDPSTPPGLGAVADATPSAEDLPVTVIEARHGWRPVDLRELWRYRELLFFLVWRDVKVRYKQTALGVAWAVLQPLATTIVFSLFFGRVAQGTSGEVDLPYPLFVLTGLIPWTFFAAAISSAGQSVVGNQNLITKIYFPRLIIPLSAMGVGLLDLLISLGLLVGAMLCYGRPPASGIVLAPLILLGLAMAAAGVGILLSALTVAYRDFRYVVPFMVQLWMFATPSIYLDPEKAVGPLGRQVLPLNPAYGLIANFRRVLFEGSPDVYSLGLSLAVSLGLFLVGTLYFRKVERSFSDII